MPTGDAPWWPLCVSSEPDCYATDGMRTAEGMSGRGRGCAGAIESMHTAIVVSTAVRIAV